MLHLQCYKEQAVTAIIGGRNRRPHWNNWCKLLIILAAVIGIFEHQVKTELTLSYVIPCLHKSPQGINNFVVHFNFLELHKYTYIVLKIN